MGIRFRKTWIPIRETWIPSSQHYLHSSWETKTKIENQEQKTSDAGYWNPQILDPSINNSISEPDLTAPASEPKYFTLYFHSAADCVVLTTTRKSAATHNGLILHDVNQPRDRTMHTAGFAMFPMIQTSWDI